MAQAGLAVQKGKEMHVELKELKAREKQQVMIPSTRESERVGLVTCCWACRISWARNLLSLSRSHLFMPGNGAGGAEGEGDACRAEKAQGERETTGFDPFDPREIHER